LHPATSILTLLARLLVGSFWVRCSTAPAVVLAAGLSSSCTTAPAQRTESQLQCGEGQCSSNHQLLQVHHIVQSEALPRAGRASWAVGAEDAAPVTQGPLPAVSAQAAPQAWLTALPAAALVLPTSPAAALPAVALAAVPAGAPAGSLPPATPAPAVGSAATSAPESSTGAIPRTSVASSPAAAEEEVLRVLLPSLKVDAAAVAHEEVVQAPIPAAVPAYPGLSSMLLMTMDVLKNTADQDFSPFARVPPEASFVEGPQGSQTTEPLRAQTRVTDIWGRDVFPDARAHPRDGDEGFNFFTAASLQEWLVLLGTCMVLCLFDFFVLQRLPDTCRMHVAAIAFWICAAMLFNMWVWSRMGPRKAFEWCSGYVLEWMLSMDNLFVFHIIFQTYQTPAHQIHKAVFVGVFGAVAMRMIFFMVVSTLLHLVHWIRFPFGVLLIWSGIEAAKGGDDEQDVKDTWLIQNLRRCLGSRLAEHYDEGGALFVKESEGRWQATLLAIVVVCLECTDIIFALDSVGAKVAQIPDQYIAFSSSVLAMYGLRAMFFVIQDLVAMFDLLQYGLCMILVFIGTELMFSQYIHLAASTVCFLILSVFVISIVGSWARKHLGLQVGTGGT